MYWWLNHSVHGLADEQRHQFIFAPLHNSKGHARDHWTRLGSVHRGDIILAFTRAGLHAVLTAKADCRLVPYPAGFRDADMGGRPDGRGFSVDWQPLEAVLPRHEVLAEVDRAALIGYGLPLRVNGDRKLGYVFEMPSPIGKQIHERAVPTAKRAR